MIYLSDKHGWDQWCPKDLKIRARVRLSWVSGRLWGCSN